MSLKTDRKRIRGFTLSELLIALAILGIIATFTIPKVLQAQQDSKSKAAAKEIIAAVSAASTSYKLANTQTSNTNITDYTPYLNYVRVDTVNSIDRVQTLGGSYGCFGSCPCLLMHNGGRVRYCSINYGGTASTNAVWFHFDPDGVITDSTTNGPAKTIEFYIYYNGRVSTRGYIDPGTADGVTGVRTADPTYDPPWFSWN